MNAHFTAYMNDTPLAARRALADSIEIYGNEDAVGREQCIEAIASGRPAFWTSRQYHDARANALRYDATKTGDVVGSMLALYPPHRRDSREAALDSLVPLDRRAAVALSLAYAEIGFFRDEPELLLRSKCDCRRAA